MLDRIRNEPVVFWGLLEGVAIAVIGLLTLFEVVQWTEVQYGGVLLVIATVGGVFAFLVRRQVTPSANAKTSEGVALIPRTGSGEGF